MSRLLKMRQVLASNALLQYLLPKRRNTVTMTLSTAWEIPNTFPQSKPIQVSFTNLSCLTIWKTLASLNQLMNYRLCCECQVLCDSVLYVLVLMFHVQSGTWAAICNKPIYLFIYLIVLPHKSDCIAYTYPATAAIAISEPSASSYRPIDARVKYCFTSELARRRTSIAWVAICDLALTECVLCRQWRATYRLCRLL